MLTKRVAAGLSRRLRQQDSAQPLEGDKKSRPWLV
jgi:hypothetical protein